MDSGRSRILIWAVSGVFLLLLTGLFGYQMLNQGTDKSLTANGKIGGPFELIDHNGNPITEAAFAGHPTVIFFGFTHCPEVCPTTLYELSGWFEALGEDGKSIRAFFVTVDPERDTPELMKSYVTNFSDRITGITGDPSEVFKLAKSWYVFWKKVPSEDGDGDYTLDHTASIFLSDRDGNFKGSIAYGESAESAVQKLKRLAAS